MYRILEKLVAIINSQYQQKRIMNFFENLNIEVAIDVGSHKGEFIDELLLKLKKVKEIHAFEPQKEIFKELQYKYKNKKKINLNNFALASKKGEAILNINKLSSASSIRIFNKKSLWYKFRNLLISEKNSVILKKKIKVNTIDNYFNLRNISSVDLLKIDVEGYELEVLKGATKNMSNIKYIVVEFTRNNAFQNYNSKLVSEFLTKKNFRLERKIIFPLLNFEDRIYKNYNK
jgi:FkbM family methyltransferase